MIETRRLFLAALITAALGLGTAPFPLLRVTMMTMMTIVASVLVATVETMTTMMMMTTGTIATMTMTITMTTTMTTTDGVAPAQEGVDVTMMTINSNFLSQL